MLQFKNYPNIIDTENEKDHTIYKYPLNLLLIWTDVDQSLLYEDVKNKIATFYVNGQESSFILGWIKYSEILLGFDQLSGLPKKEMKFYVSGDVYSINSKGQHIFTFIEGSDDSHFNYWVLVTDEQWNQHKDTTRIFSVQFL